MNKVIVKKLSEKEIDNLGINSWPVWEKEVSRFNWKYDSEEQCYILEGEFTVKTEDGDFHIVPGDYVVFKEGLSCIWDISKPVKKHYKFS